MKTVFTWSNLSPCGRALTGKAEAITGERQQWCKMMQNGSMFSRAACCQDTCIHTTSQHLPVWVNEATKMTWEKRNNSNPLRILRLYKTDILEKKRRASGGVETSRGGYVQKRKITEKCLKVRDLVVVGTPASCELQQQIPASVRDQLAISWNKKKNNPNAENKTKSQKENSVRQKWQLRALDYLSNLSLLMPNRSDGRTSKRKNVKERNQ